MNKLSRPDRINSIKANSIKNGESIQILDQSYRGKAPVYQNTDFGPVKVKKGIPFVRMTKKPHEVKWLKSWHNYE